MPNTQNQRGNSSSPSATTGRSTEQAMNQTGRSHRGFAAMDSEMQRRIASEGGRASHASGRGHQWTPEEARAAGRKGGEARAQNQVSTSKGASAEAGRQGGAAGSSRGSSGRAL
jgi:general stress protein YciG